MSVWNKNNTASASIMTLNLGPGPRALSRRPQATSCIFYQKNKRGYFSLANVHSLEPTGGIVSQQH